MTLRLISLPTIGRGQHRSGWPHAVKYIRALCSESGTVLLDDYVDHTFLSTYRSRTPITHEVPWIGICHHPPDMPDWYAKTGLNHLDQCPAWRASLPWLRLLVFLTESSTRWAAARWGTPCITLKHPTAVPKLRWSVAAYGAGASRLLVQAGAFLRNTHAIYQVRVPDHFSKIRISQSEEWIRKAHADCSSHLKARPFVGTVQEVRDLTNNDYDVLLARSVVFIELIAAGANNVVVECIARNTPIVINRLDGPENYLGSAYPLFYNHIEEVHDLLTEERILDAHKYLRRLDKSWISPRVFAESLVAACRAHVPELGPASHPDPKR